jgi:hypothetical protein
MNLAVVMVNLVSHEQIQGLMENSIEK